MYFTSFAPQSASIVSSVQAVAFAVVVAGLVAFRWMKVKATGGA